MEKDPEALLSLFNTCLRGRKFLERWKTVRLVLLHKSAGKPITDSKSFRQLCLLNNVAKLLERLIHVRLSRGVVAKEGLTCNQHGFRGGRATVHAIKEVLNITEFVTAGADREGAFVFWLPLTSGTPSIKHHERR